MARKPKVVVTQIAKSEKWTMSVQGEEQPRAVFDTKEGAEDTAKELSKNIGAELVMERGKAKPKKAAKK